MKLTKTHIIGLAVGVAIMAISLFFQKSNLFFFMIWFGVIIAVLPFVITTIAVTKIDQEKEAMFWNSREI